MKDGVSTVTFSEYLRAFLRHWWLLLLFLAAGIAGAWAVTSSSDPVYRSTVQFYVVAPSTERQSALQSDELVRGRITAYAVLLKSDQFAERITAASQEDLDPVAVKNSISGYGDPETLTLTVNVMEPDQSTADEIATQIAETFGDMVNDLESGSTSETVLNVVSGPTTSDRPVRPRPQLNLAIGAVLGLGAGALMVLLRVRTDTSIRSVSELEAASGLANLASVPGNQLAGAFGGQGRSSGGAAVAEAMRILRTSLVHLPGTPPRTIAVTAANPGAGKTSAAVRLAQSYAETPARVLLIEADLRNPVLAEAAGVQSGPGLAGILEGTALPAAAIQTAGQLDILVAGTSVRQPSQLLSGGRMPALLAELRSSYDVVVLDTAAVLQGSDALIVCAEAEGTVLVLARGRTSAADVSTALRRLGSVRCTVLGTVLTGVREDHRFRRSRTVGSTPAGRAAKSDGNTGDPAGSRDSQPADVRG